MWWNVVTCLFLENPDVLKSLRIGTTNHWAASRLLLVPDFHRVQAPLKWGGSTLRTKKSWVNIWPWRTLSTDTFLILFSKWAMNFSNRFCHVYMSIRLCLYISLYLVPPTQLVIAELEAYPIVELLQEWVYIYMERSHLFYFGIVTVAATPTATICYYYSYSVVLILQVLLPPTTIRGVGRLGLTTGECHRKPHLQTRSWRCQSYGGNQRRPRWITGLEHLMILI